MKKFRKKIFRYSTIQAIIVSISVAYLFVVKITSSWKHENTDIISKSWTGEEPVIVAFWHNRLLLMPFCWKSKSPFHMLISKHSDGNIISNIINFFGISSIRGSSSSGGSMAIRKLLEVIKSSSSVGITPDGPRGPLFKANKGSITLSQLSGVKIIPVSASVSRKKTINTWDKLVFPLPFSKGICIWGEPIIIPRHLKENEKLTYIQKLEDSLNNIIVKTEKHFNRSETK